MASSKYQIRVVLAEEVGRLKERNRALEAVMLQKDAEVAAAEEETRAAEGRVRNLVESLRACEQRVNKLQT